MKRAEPVLWGCLGAAAALAAWQWGAAGSRVIPTPWRVALAFGELYRKGLLASYVAASLARVAAGYGAAALFGLPLGALLGSYPGARRYVDTAIQLLRPISPLAWMPLAVVWFGVGNAAPVFLIFVGAFFPILLWTADGVRNVPKRLVAAGRNFCPSPAAVAFRVMLPAAFPRILAGLRAALGIAWVVVVAAEMIAVDSGLGYLIIDARNAGQRYDLVIAGMLLIGGIGILLDSGLARAGRIRALSWGSGYDGIH
jgi:NitT/TauT family transport system permease protein